MSKRTFRIGQLATHLKVERFVIRFWEKEFKVQSQRSPGGQRFYEEKDLERFMKIKELLYDKGFTIAGAKKALKVKDPVAIIASSKTTFDQQQKIEAQQQEIEQLSAQIISLQEKLLKLRKLL